MAPDAGSILRQQPQPPAAPPPPPQRIVPAEAQRDRPDGGPRVLVRGFRIQGNTLFSEAELAAQLQGSIGQDLTLRQLEGTAAILTAYYVQRGFVARVFAPPQDVKDGIVVLQVVEGKRGSVRVTAQGDRIDAKQVEGFVDNRLGRGAALDITRLGEALNILNEQPGLSVRATVAPGQREAEIDIVLSTSETARAQPFANFNNHGLAGTGEAQVSGGVVLNNASGRLDALTLLANASEGTRYGRVEYSLPLGDSGLRVGINASHLRYDVVLPALAALNARGTAKTVGLTATYPLARRDRLNLTLQGSLEHKRLVDNTVAGETSNRQVAIAGLGVSGSMTGAGPLPDGLTSFGVGLVTGTSDQRNAVARATDATTRGADGSLAKLHYNLGYLHPLPDAWRVSASLRGQMANGNLDSSERFSLGGPNGVRAYPIGEAIGDEGWLFSLGLTRQISGALSASVFYDLGSIRLNKRTWAGWNAGNPRLENSYRLSGVGFGLEWRIANRVFLSASVATVLGDNPGRDAAGNNADGKDSHTRGWISLNAQF